MALKWGTKGAPEEPSSNDYSLEQQSISMTVTFLGKLIEKMCEQHEKHFAIIVILSLYNL